jgi:hypothetical protein
MVYVSFRDFANIAEEVIGDLHKVPTSRPYPWFCKDIFAPNDLQWAGYIGNFAVYKGALVFGINLEFTGGWKRILPKIRTNIQLFSSLLSEFKDLEWHWMGRPAQRYKDPPIKYITPNMWTYQVDYVDWLSELEDIIDQKMMWKPSVPMRPQIQVMRLIGLPNEMTHKTVIKPNIQQTVLDLQRIVEFFRR